jgi:hypothetical protein
MYEISTTERMKLKQRFQYHPPMPTQCERYQEFRDQCHRLAVRICELCPPSDERKRAIDRLDEVMMLANAAIARTE